MYSILLTAKKPDVADHNHTETYNKFVRILGGITKQNKDIRLLAEGAILIPLFPGLQGILDVLKSLKDLPYSYTILTQETLWHEATNII